MSRELIFRRVHKEGLYRDMFFDFQTGYSYYYCGESKRPRIRHQDEIWNLVDDKWHQIEQYTGLRDCNGKMIFENDIIRVYRYGLDDSKYWDGKVYWEHGGWYVDEITGNEDYEGYFLTDCFNFDDENVQVIGNVHERT